MLSLKLKKDSGGRVVWEDVPHGRKYRRVAGGMAWPGPDAYDPNCRLAILGEGSAQDVASGRHNVWILHEEAFVSVEDMLDAACSWMERIYCRDWILPEHEPQHVRVDHWIRERRRRRMPVPHFCAPPVHDFVELNAMMQARTTTTKTFFFGADSPASAAYATVPDTDFLRSVHRYPAIAAVLYPLSYLDMTERRALQVRTYVPAEGGY